MTVETTTRRVIANGNGSATSFSFDPMVIYQSSDLVVVKRDTAGVETVLAEGSGASDYIVVVSSYPGTGTITFPASGTTKLASGEKLAIVPRIPIEQDTDLDNQGGYFADIQELQFDKLVHIDQQQQEQLERALKISVSDNSVTSTDLGKLTANYVLAVNADATGFLWSASLPGNVTVSAFMQTVLDDASAAAARTTLGVTASLEAINSLTPAADRLPYYTSSSAAALATFTSFARTLMDDADAPAARATLQVAKSAGLFGLRLSNNVTDANNDIDIAVGECLDDAGTYFLRLTAGLTKRLDATWTVGTNQGGLDTGAEAASTPYAVWLIARSDTGVVDALFSTSFTAPTMPASYDKKRLIGAVVNNSVPSLRPFVQRGDSFFFTDAQASDVSDSTIVNATFETGTMILPPLVIALVHVVVDFVTAASPAANAVWVKPTNSTLFAADIAGAVIQVGGLSGTDITNMATTIEIPLDANRQLQYAASETGSNTTTVSLQSRGFRMPQLTMGD